MSLRKIIFLVVMIRNNSMSNKKNYTHHILDKVDNFYVANQHMNCMVGGDQDHAKVLILMITHFSIKKKKCELDNILFIILILRIFVSFMVLWIKRWIFLFSSQVTSPLQITIAGFFSRFFSLIHIWLCFVCVFFLYMVIIVFEFMASVVHSIIIESIRYFTN